MKHLYLKRTTCRQNIVFEQVLMFINILFIPVVGLAQSADITINIDLDRNENQTSWTLTGPGGFSESGGPYLDADDIITQIYTVSISGTYIFTIYDSGSNGLTDNRSGDENRTSSYSISVDGSVIYASASSPNFGAQATHTFDISLVDECDATASGNTDTDGDNVSDICDLDSDNDGILDSEECDDVVFTDLSVVTWTAINGGDKNDIDIGDVFIVSNYITINEQVYDLRWELISRYPTSGTGSDFYVKLTPRIEIESGVYAAGSYFIYDIKLVRTGTVTAANLTGVTDLFNGITIEIRDLDNVLAGRTDVGAFISPVPDTEVPGAYIGQLTLPDGQEVWGLADYSVLNNEDNDTNPAAEYSVTGTINKLNSGIRLLHGIYGESTNASSLRGTSLKITIKECLDTDADGIPDYLDTDSDNDGCADAVEAAADIYEYDLTELSEGSNGGSILNLGTKVDADGVPTQDVNSNVITAIVPQATTTAVTDENENDACKADLSLQKVVEQPLGTAVTDVQVNSIIYYVLTVKNDGPHPVNLVHVKDVLPEGVTYISHTATVGTYDVATGIWCLTEYDIFDVGETETLTITATVGPDCEDITNFTEVIQMDRVDIDSTPGNNQ